MNELPESAMHYLDASHGQYIPQAFFEQTKPECINWHCDDETKAWILESCANPESENYWEAWSDAEAYGYVTVIEPGTGIEYSLYQDGDLWLVPVDAEWPQS